MRQFARVLTMLCALFLPVAAFAQPVPAGRVTIVVAPIQFEAEVNGKPANFERTLRRDIETALEATGLFTVANRDQTDLDQVLDEIVLTGRRGAKAIKGQFIITTTVTAMEMGDRRRAAPNTRDTDVSQVAGRMSLRLTVMRASDAGVKARMPVEVTYQGQSRLADPVDYGGPKTYAASQMDFGGLSTEAGKAVAKRVLDQVNPAVIIQRTADQVWISRGADSGYKIGEVVRIMKVGVELKDPRTGEVLDREDREIGRGRIVEVRPRVSIATVTQSTEDIPAGAIIREPVAAGGEW